MPVPRRYGLTRALTPTEEKIFAGVVARATYADIGKEIGGISQHTVRVHVAAIATKIIGCEDLDPATAITVYSRWLEWERSRSVTASARQP